MSGGRPAAPPGSPDASGRARATIWMAATRWRSTVRSVATPVYNASWPIFLEGYHNMNNPDNLPGFLLPWVGILDEQQLAEAAALHAADRFGAALDAYNQ